MPISYIILLKNTKNTINNIIIYIIHTILSKLLKYQSLHYKIMYVKYKEYKR